MSCFQYLFKNKPRFDMSSVNTMMNNNLIFI